MMTLEEARQKQARLQKQTITKFSIYMTLIIAAFATLLAFTDYFTKYSILYAIFLIFLYLTCKNSKIYYFFKPKEFVGEIIYCNVTVERVQAYASHQPGVKYTTNEVYMLDFIVKKNNKTVRRNIEYDWHWGDFYEGQTVVLLRFIDRPFLIKNPNQ